MARRYFAAAAVMLAVMAGSLAGFSQDESGRTVYGAGNNTCAQWTQAREGGTWMTAGQWVLGFVSASAVYSKTPPAKTDARAIAGWVDKYCMADAGKEVADAARELVELLVSGRQP